MAAVPFGLQLYTVREPAEKDPAGTLRRVREIGYEHVELAGTYGMSAAELKKVLDDCGLTVVSSHVGYEEMVTNTSKVIDDCKTFGAELTCVPWIGGDAFSTKAAWAECARKMDEAGARLREAGIRLSYHNHAHEFELVDGTVILDLIFSTASPENLAAELDTYWVQYGGADPVAKIREFTNRLPLLHVKDMAPGPDRNFAEMGRGILDWPAIFAAARDAGVQWYIVEQDTCPGDPLESARISCEFMAQVTV